ncbi:MAG: phosphopentomutase [Xanthomonadales bacterium]|nr:phosphopentomutase [Xanthomonadales bacterium]
MVRVVLIVMDSLGVGALPDAEAFGDLGSDTFGHIAAYCERPVRQGGRGRPLAIRALRRLGLVHAAALGGGLLLPDAPPSWEPEARWGCARERSTGKDTVSGHWELCGLPVTFDWGYFQAPQESLPAALVEAIAQRAGCDSVLGNCHASGTTIIQDLGERHIASGKPIIYTSADSVVQIAAHEQHFGLQRLYSLCEETRRLVDPYRIGRVIARPFTGTDASSFRRTANRRDWATPPPAPTLLDGIEQAGGTVLGVGKIGDIFAMRGITESIKASGVEALMTATADALKRLPTGGLVFTNLVDFDQEYGHRRDVAGYAAEIERFDGILEDFLRHLGSEDLLLLTADHGNDPTHPGSDHTREHIPVLAFSQGLSPGGIGIRESFADVGQSIAHWLRLPPLQHGESFL